MPEPRPSPIDPDLHARLTAALQDRVADLRERVHGEGEGADAALEARYRGVREVRVGLRRVRYGLVDAADLRARIGELLATTAEPAPERDLYGDVLAALPATTPVRREFYVYLHRAPDGAVFYVGKGRARRAWSRARTAVWRRYVDERLGGAYAVEIHRDGLTHGEALALEAELVLAHGARLVNWVNPSRDFDAALRERAALLRTETLGRVGTAGFLEDVAPHEALRRYRLALEDVRLYCRWPVERGLLGELKDPDRAGEPLVLDRLTRLLERLGRAAEIVAAADEYFADFPAAVRTPAGERVRRRRERALAGRLHVAAHARPGGRRVLG